MPSPQFHPRGADAKLHVVKSVNSSNQKSNPVACWKLAAQRINAFAFSPDNTHLAVVTEGGRLQVIDYLKEEYAGIDVGRVSVRMAHHPLRLLDVYSSYYGGLICVCWSPDGKYILTGGQDDLVSIWSLADCCIVARCEGHQSWVTAVAFDPWRCDVGNYRFGSVGEDCRLLLWDFSVNMLHRPKAVRENIFRLRNVSSPYDPKLTTSIIGFHSTAGKHLIGVWGYS